MFRTPVPKTDYHIVLDLDETAVHTYMDEDDEKLSGKIKEKIKENPDLIFNMFYFELNDFGERRGTGTTQKVYACKRPFLKDFLVFCFRFFKSVNVWSAGEERYVHHICKKIFHGNRLPLPKTIFTRNDCTKSPNGMIKPLSDMYKIRRDMNSSNTMILDDNPTSYSRNKDNGLRILPFEPHIDWLNEKFDDKCLNDVTEWIQLNLRGTDVRKVSKKLY